MPDKNILILYYSRTGAVRELARAVAGGVESVPHCAAMLRTAPPVSATNESVDAAIPERGDVYVTLDEVAVCDGLILGSPTRFGTIAAPLKYFFEQTTPLWLNGALNGKPGAAFTSGGSMHGGQESTLLAMLLPLLHHGMLIVGIPFFGTALDKTTAGGAPYGASHVAGRANNLPINADEKQFAEVLGRRVAHCAQALANAPVDN